MLRRKLVTSMTVLWSLLQQCMPMALGEVNLSKDAADWAHFNPYKSTLFRQLVPNPYLTSRNANLYNKGPAFPQDPTRTNLIFGRGVKSLPTVIYAKAFDILLIGNKLYQAPAAGESKYLQINGQSLTIYGTSFYTPLRDNRFVANPAQISPFDPSRVFYKESKTLPSVIYAEPGKTITISNQSFIVPPAGKSVILTVGADGRIKAQESDKSQTQSNNSQARSNYDSKNQTGKSSAGDSAGSTGMSSPADTKDSKEKTASSSSDALSSETASSTNKASAAIASSGAGKGATASSVSAQSSGAIPSSSIQASSANSANKTTQASTTLSSTTQTKSSSSSSNPTNLTAINNPSPSGAINTAAAGVNSGKKSVASGTGPSSIVSSGASAQSTISAGSSGSSSSFKAPASSGGAIAAPSGISGSQTGSPSGATSGNASSEASGASIGKSGASSKGSGTSTGSKGSISGASSGITGSIAGGGTAGSSSGASEPGGATSAQGDTTISANYTGAEPLKGNVQQDNPGSIYEPGKLLSKAEIIDQTNKMLQGQATIGRKNQTLTGQRCLFKPESWTNLGTIKITLVWMGSPIIQGKTITPENTGDFHEVQGQYSIDPPVPTGKALGEIGQKVTFHVTNAIDKYNVTYTWPNNTDLAAVPLTPDLVSTLYPMTTASPPPTQNAPKEDLSQY